MKTLPKALLVAAGYAAAWIAAGWATSLFDARLTAADPANASGGMAAFGVMVFFLQAFALMALFPTALGLWFLRSCLAFWETVSRWSRSVSATGIATLVLFVPLMQLNRSPSLAKNQWLALCLLLVGVRLAGALFCGAIDLLGAIFSPLPEPRRRFIQSLLVEGMVFGSGLAIFLWWPRG